MSRTEEEGAGCGAAEEGRLTSQHLNLMRSVLPPLRASAAALGRLIGSDGGLAVTGGVEEEKAAAAVASDDAPLSEASFPLSFPPSAPGSSAPGSVAVRSDELWSCVEGCTEGGTGDRYGGDGRCGGCGGEVEIEEDEDEGDEEGLARALSSTRLSDPRSLAGCYAEHTVGVGETIATIAMRYGISQGELRAWNRLLLAPNLSVGQQLWLEPPPARSADAIARAESSLR